MSFLGNVGCGCSGGGNDVGGNGCQRPSVPVAATGLCLADGTPIAVVSTRGTDGRMSLSGWLNLATGSFNRGRPPSSAQPCSGSGGSGGLTGVHVQQWCDLDSEGEVLTPVLAAYEFDETGELSGVELLTPDGEPYEVQGTLGVCDTSGVTEVTGPDGEPVEVSGTIRTVANQSTVLCDHIDSGEGTETITFVRDYERDDDGNITGHSDYTLTGEPYEPVGDVEDCGAVSPCDDPSAPVATTGLCLADGTPIAVTVERDCHGIVSRTGWIDLSTGIYSEGEYPEGTRACGESNAFHVSGLLCDVDPDSGDVLGLALVELERGDDGEITGTRLIDPTDGEEYELQGELTVCPAGVEQPQRDLIVLCDAVEDGEGTQVTRFVRDYARDENGAITGHSDYTLDGEAYDPLGEVTSCDDTVDTSAQQENDLVYLCDTVGGGEDNETTVFVRDYERDTSGKIIGYVDYTLTGDLYEPVGDVGICPSVDGPVEVTGTIRTECHHCETLTLCDHIDSGEDDEHIPFLRTICHDCDGNLASTRDTMLDGETPYEPVGNVTQCSTAGSDCRDTTTLMLCHMADPDEPVTPSAEDASVPPRDDAFASLPDGGQDLWNGGTLVFPEDENASEGDGKQVYRTVGARITADPVCGDSGTLKFSVQVRNDGPNPGVGTTGDLRLLRNGKTMEVDWVAGSAPVDHEQTLTVSVPVTAGDLQSGDLLAALSLETYQDGPKSWTVDEFTILVDWDGCETQFLRTLSTDCETGEVVSVSDTTFDGEPYEVTGRVVQCGSTGRDTSPPSISNGWADVESLLLCSVDSADEDADPQQVLVEYVYDSDTGERVETRYLDPTTNEPVEIPEGASLVDCGSIKKPCRNTQSVLLCDDHPDCSEPKVGDLDSPASYNNYDAGEEPGTYCLVDTPGEGTPLWEGESITLGPDDECDVGNNGIHRVVGARLQAGRADADGTENVTVSVRVTNDGPNDGHQGDGMLVLWDLAEHTHLATEEVPRDAEVGVSHVVTVSGEVPADLLAAGDIGVVLDLETEHRGEKSWTVESFEWSSTASCDSTQFIRQIITDCDGTTVSVVDIDLDGEPYEVEGEVGKCESTGQGGGQPPESDKPCRSTQSVLLCNNSTELESGSTTVEDTSDQLREHSTFTKLPDGGQDLWDGESLKFPEDSDGEAGNGTETQRWVAGILTSPAPVCDDGTATADVSVSVDLTNDGPDICGSFGSMTLLRISDEKRYDHLGRGFGTEDGTVVESGETITVTLNGTIPASELASGEVGVWLNLRTYRENPNQGCDAAHSGPGQWTASGFTVDVKQNFDAEPCSTQFLRNVITDCETGEIVETIDTTLDGEPYEVTGEVGQCQPTSGGECCPDPEPKPSQDIRCETFILCDTGPDGDDPVSFMRAVCRDSTGEVVSVTDTELDATTPYEVRT